MNDFVYIAYSKQGDIQMFKYDAYLVDKAPLEKLH